MTQAGAALTSRGWVVLAAAAVMALAGVLFGIEELYPLAAAAAALVLAGRVWVAAARSDVQVMRIVHPTRLPAGGEARVELAVRNAGARRTPPIGAADSFDKGRRWARFAIAPLNPGESRRASYRLPASTRGIYHLGPLQLHFTDPLGMARKVVVTAPDTSLTVHPAYELMPVGAASSHRDEDQSYARPSLGKEGDGFYALREYVPGDDLRHVHWPSTARLDDLVIRQPENRRQGRVTVAADLRAPLHDQDSLEAVLSGVAGLAMSCLRAGLEVRVVTTAGFDSGHGRARTHAPAILDGLAAASAHRPAGAAPFRIVGTSDPVILVTTDRSSAADVRSIVRQGGATGTTLVVFETGAQAQSPPGFGIRVPLGASFAKVWAGHEAARC
jgi:uncharacterized protein (DUF58 family)